jgi:hypothetical protein
MIAAYLKPTWVHIYADFEAEELQGLAQFLYERGRTKALITSARIKPYFQPSFTADTFKRLGWAIPELPPVIPKGWTGKVGNPPYPKYNEWPRFEPGKEIALMPFPEPGDLIAPWYFKGKRYEP